MIDSDTIIMPDTKEAVYRAAGSVIMAVDKIFQNEFR
jgi:acetoin utilization deacetylase AcuC-like enzyme